jgi:hypothetical protein
VEPITELFGSDLTLIGAVLTGLALTSLGIVRDVSPFRLRPSLTAKVDP